MGEDVADVLPTSREDPRLAHTRERVLAAARRIVSAEGHAAVTPTRLAEISGVARSTIYRHWANTAAVIVDAISLDDEYPAMAFSGETETDLRAYLEQLREVLESGAASAMVTHAEIAEREQPAAEAVARNESRRSKLVHEYLGDPRPQCDEIHAQLVGPLFMQRFFARRPITDALIEAVVAGYMTSRADQSAEIQ